MKGMCYWLVFIEPNAQGVFVVSDVGLFSEPHDSITHEACVVPVLVETFDGRDYHEARARALTTIQHIADTFKTRIGLVALAKLTLEKVERG